MRSTIVVILLCVFAGVTDAATICTGPSASGDGSGSDWNNKFAWSGTLVRGNKYMLEDGSYSSKTLSVALSGSSVITIQKATVADHGPSSGWSDTMGDGQAIIDGLTFSTGYWTVDGSTGSTYDNMGIVMAQPSNCATTDHRIVIGTGAQTIDNLTFNYIAARACADDQEKMFFYCGTQVTANNYTWSHIYADGFQGTFFLWGVSNVLTEYVLITNAFSSASHHGEQWNLRYGSSRSCKDVTVRYCTIADSTGTGCIIANDGGSDEMACLGLNVYGNVFRGGSGPNGVVGTTTRGAFANVSVFNNTFSGASGSPWISAAQASSSTAIKNAVTNIVATNNIIYNQSAAIADNATNPVRHDYNMFVSCTSVPSEANGVTTSTNPFVDSSSQNYHLSAGTAAGVTLGSPFTQDMDGVSRGSDGVWDRGAYEYVSGGGAATYSTAASGKITISGKATIQ